LGIAAESVNIVGLNAGLDFIYDYEAIFWVKLAMTVSKTYTIVEHENNGTMISEIQINVVVGASWTGIINLVNPNGTYALSTVT
jgi:hypothetical protein